MQSRIGPASSETAQMAYVLQHGQPSICYQKSDQHIKVLQKASPRATIGGFKDRFLPEKMGSLNAKEWKKGLKYC
jgi:hypothetical protein